MCVYSISDHHVCCNKKRRKLLSTVSRHIWQMLLSSVASSGCSSCVIAIHHHLYHRLLFNWWVYALNLVSSMNPVFESKFIVQFFYRSEIRLSGIGWQNRATEGENTKCACAWSVHQSSESRGTFHWNWYYFLHIISCTLWCH